MNRRQLIFVILFNAIISLLIALVVVWAVEARRPDPEELAIQYTPATVPAQGQPTAVAAPPDPAIQPTATPVVDVAPEPTLAVGDTEIYIVQTGDSLSSIADRFRIPIDTLVRINELANPDVVFVGQRLQIPVSGNGGDVAPTDESNNEPVTQGVVIQLVEAPGDLLAEAVQVTNDNDRAVNLSGWVLDREGGPSYTFGNVPLFPGSYVWLHTQAGDNTSIAIYWGRDAAAWPAGTLLRLHNPQGAQVSTFSVP
ncbi:MAG: LysM peptidoglycan-binding domain-containing protein [Caldilineaceae bacterium]